MSATSLFRSDGHWRVFPVDECVKGLAVVGLHPGDVDAQWTALLAHNGVNFASVARY